MKKNQYKHIFVSVFSISFLFTSSVQSTPSAVKQKIFDEYDGKEAAKIQPSRPNPLEGLAMVCAFELRNKQSKTFHNDKNQEEKTATSSSDKPKSCPCTKTDEKIKDDKQEGTPTHTYNLRSKKSK